MKQTKSLTEFSRPTEFTQLYHKLSFQNSGLDSFKVVFNSCKPIILCMGYTLTNCEDSAQTLQDEASDKSHHGLLMVCFYMF